MPFAAVAPLRSRLPAGRPGPWRLALAWGCVTAAGGLVLAAPASAAEPSKPAPAAKPAPAPASGAPAALSPHMPGYDYLADKRINPRTPLPPAAASGASGTAGAAGAAPTAVAPPASAPSLPPVRQDPMDRLQQRLAERLGARMSAAENKKDGELRLVAREAGPPGKPGGKGAAAAAPPSGAGRAAVRPGAAGAAVPAAAPVAWSYEGAGGPAHWAGLKPEYAACGKGERQSPIDIRDGLKLQLEPLRFAYQASGFRVIDNGRTVRVNIAGGNRLDVMGRRYELKYFEFHRPAEVRIEGKAFDMSAHLVHEDAEGRVAVVAVPLERGAAHPGVQAVWNNLPLEKHAELAAPSPLDPATLLPQDGRYATFMGSMTTPPCQEGVLWMVMKTPVAVSDYQLAVFSRLYPMNARPVQPAHGRLIKESE